MEKIDFCEIEKEFYKNKLEILSQEYKNARTKLIVKNEDGYLGLQSYSNLKIKELFNPFKKNNPYVIYNINKYIENNKLKCKLLSTEYISTDENLIFECECGNQFSVSWHSFKTANKTKCKICNRKNMGEKSKHSFQKVKELFLSKGYHILNDSYKNNSDNIHVIDLNGYKGITTYTRLKIDNFPMPFHVQNPYTIENIKTYIKNNKIKSKLLSNNYINHNEKLCFLCECGKKFYVSLDSFLHQERQKCFKCNKVKSKIELKTEKWLIENNIEFIPQYKFSDCRYKRILSFDFAIFHNKILVGLIEVDGIQHYEKTSFFYNVEKAVNKNYESQQIRDKIKNEYCLNNNINLLRLKYYYFQTDFYKTKLIEYFIGIDILLKK